jgi:hypothetical protein
VNELHWDPGPEQLIEVAQVDYLHPRCTLAVWNTKEPSVAVYPGSTVPAQKHIDAAVPKQGRGTNLLAEGLLRFMKGDHPRIGGKNQHAAFLQDEPFPHRRTKDDNVFENEDEVSVDRIGDNFHCGYCESSSKVFITSSQGCQVVCGFPHRPNHPDKTKDVGAWPRFRDLAYKSKQKTFHYMLVPGSAAAAAALSAPGTLPATLRFGSSGDLVEGLQGQLKKKGLLKTDPDGDFGALTLLALVELQRQLGISPDGICGLNTAEALGLKNWPRH